MNTKTETTKTQINAEWLANVRAGAEFYWANYGKFGEMGMDERAVDALAMQSRLYIEAVSAMIHGKAEVSK